MQYNVSVGYDRRLTDDEVLGLQAWVESNLPSISSLGAYVYESRSTLGGMSADDYQLLMRALCTPGALLPADVSARVLTMIIGGPNPGEATTYVGPNAEAVEIQLLRKRRSALLRERRRVIDQLDAVDGHIDDVNTRIDVLIEHITKRRSRKD